MIAVTPSQRRGMTVFVCIGCDKLALSSRSNALTCSPACRTRVHRHPKALAALKATCALKRVPPEMVMQCTAVDRLRPDLAERIACGEIEVSDTRSDMVTAMLNLLNGAA